MIIHDRFIHLHLQKCGGTFIRKWLFKAFPNEVSDVSGRHKGLDERPTDKFVFGTIRNPWDWYVSLWASNINQKNLGTFSDTFKQPVSFEYFLNYLLKEGKGKVHDLDLNKMAGENIGALTYRFNKTYRVYPDFVSRIENLVTELPYYFSNFYFPLHFKQIELLGQMLHYNNSNRNRDYRYYYNDNMIELVTQKDKEIIDKFNYKYAED